MTHIAVRHEVPAPTVVVIDDDVRAQIFDLVAKADAIDTVDDASFAESNKLVAAMAALERAIEDSRKQVKAPVLDLGRNIDSAARSVLDPCARSRKRVAALIDKRQREIEVERRRVEAENQRRIEEARRKVEEEKRRREAEIAALESQGAESEDDKRALEELHIEHQAEGQRTAIVALEQPPEPEKSVVSARVNKIPEIVDASQIPHAMNGIELMRPVMANIRKLLVAGVAVPGARLVEQRTLATRRR